MTSSTDQVQQLVQNALRQFENIVLSKEAPSKVLGQLVQTIAHATDATGAIVWMPTDASMQTYTPMAKTGDGVALAIDPDNQPLPKVDELIQRTIHDGKVVIVSPEQEEFAGTPLHGVTQFYVQIQAIGRILGVIHVIAAPQVDPKVYRPYAAFIQQGAQASGAYLMQRQSKILKKEMDSQGQLLAITRALLKLENPHDLIHELANQACPLLEAQRVGVVGYYRNTPDSAFSNTIDTNRRAVVVRAYEMLAQAVVERQTPMTFTRDQPLEGEDLALEPLLNQAFEMGNAQALCLTPIRFENDIIGVIIAEFDTPETASRHAANQNELSQQAGAMLRHAADTYARPLRRTSNLLASIARRPGAALFKTALAFTLIGAAIWGLFFVPIPVPIRSDARLEPSRMAVITAPHPGVIQKVLVRTNDFVTTDQALIQMEDTDLRLSYSEEDLSNQAEAVTRDEALRQLNPPAVASSNLKIEQGNIRKRSLQRLIDRSEIHSLIDGVVLTENIEQFEGRTVSQGDKLVSIADLSQFDLIMEVAEHDLVLIEQSLQHTDALKVTFLSRAWNERPQTTTITDIKSLAPTSSPNKDRSQHVYQITIGIELQGMDSQLFLANPTGRARIEAQPASIAYRFGRGIWRFLKMTLLF